MIDGPISSRVILVGHHYVIEEKWPTYTRRRTPSLEEIAQLRSFRVPIPDPTPRALVRQSALIPGHVCSFRCQPPWHDPGGPTSE